MLFFIQPCGGARLFYSVCPCSLQRALVTARCAGVWAQGDEKPRMQYLMCFSGGLGNSEQSHSAAWAERVCSSYVSWRRAAVQAWMPAACAEGCCLGHFPAPSRWEMSLRAPAAELCGWSQP